MEEAPQDEDEPPELETCLATICPDVPAWIHGRVREVDAKKQQPSMSIARSTFTYVDIVFVVILILLQPSWSLTIGRTEEAPPCLHPSRCSRLWRLGNRPVTSTQEEEEVLAKTPAAPPRRPRFTLP
ncbi:uncharacterized protein [Penaeus vannamei]|uniref:uncharacterized protein isoform X4 n=1 Tax=Penaeus vannamei TaxID=6689 RepID=UPI00387FAC2B